MRLYTGIMRRAVNQRINQSYHELINVERGISSLQTEGLVWSMRTNLPCLPTWQTRESISSLSPSNTGIKDEQLRKRSAEETSFRLAFTFVTSREFKKIYVVDVRNEKIGWLPRVSDLYIIQCRNQKHTMSDI